MKKAPKKVLIPLIVIAVMAIAAGGAYAWWTASVGSAPNTIGTGDAGLVLGGQLPISANNLVPQAALPNDNASYTGTAYKTSYFWIRNSGDTPLHFVGWLADGTEDYSVLGSQVWVKITIAPPMPQSPWDPTGSLSAPGPWLVYYGPINNLYGKALGSGYLTTIGHSPLAPGQYAYYQVVTWLNGDTCDDSSQNKSMTCTLQFENVNLP